MILFRQHLSYRLLEIDTQADACAKRGVSSEVVQAHLVIQGRFQRDKLVEEKSVSNTERYHQVVVFLGEMVVFSSSAEIDATLVEIVACASTNAHIVKIALVFVACRCIQHEAVGHKIARMRVKSEAEFLVRTV